MELLFNQLNLKKMKKTFLFVLVIATTLVSCNKESLNPNSNFQSITIQSQLDKTSKTTSNSSITIDGVQTFNDMLWFKDDVSYRSALEKLSTFQDIDIDNFNEEYFSYTAEELSQMSEEQLNIAFDKLEAKELEIGFSEEGVYIDFENQLNFNSLRKHISDLELVFLNNENPDWENNPNSHFIPFVEERTLFNEYGEIKIGDYIYILKKDIAIKILDSNYETALAMRNVANGLDKFENIEVINMNTEYSNLKSTNSGCHYNSGQGFNYPNTNSKFIEVVVGVRNSFFGIGYSVAYAETTNYQKKNCCSYTKKIANTKSKVSGDLCGYGSGSFTTDVKNKNVKSLTQKKTLGGSNYAGQNLVGYHKGINNYETYSSH